MSRWFRFLLATDVWIGSIIWGTSNETISSRIALARVHGRWWGCWGCKVLDWLFRDDDHCKWAIQHDNERAEEAERELEEHGAQSGDGPYRPPSE